MALLFKLGWYFRLEWKRYLFAMVMLAIVAVLTLAPPWITGQLVDLANQDKLTTGILLEQTGLIAGLGVLIYICRFLWRLSLYSASYRLGALLRQRLYQRLLLQPPAFFQHQKTGDLLARATNDVTAVEMSAGEAILALFDGILTGMIVLAVLFLVIDWRLTLLALFPWPIMAIAFWRINRALHDAFHSAQQRFADLNERVQEDIHGIRLIRAFGLEPRVSNEFHQNARDAAEANLQVSRCEARYEPVIFLTVGVSFLLAVAGGAWLIFQQQLTVGELTSFTLYLGYLIWPMFAYGWLLNLLERGSVAYQRIDEILQTAPAIPDNGERAIPASATLQWQIDAFCYPGQTAPALSAFSGELSAGNTLAIVGPSGAGKSTFVELLLRQREAPAAKFSLGDLELADIPLAALRNHIVVVPQAPFLFSTTIAENIALGRPDASIEEIRAAARAACLDTDIERLPDGYQTPVGERGVTLSGGQQQRLSIARALLLDAPILVLDDVLSAVDVATERTILQRLRQVRHNRTTLIICHRLTAAEEADEIIVLRHGKPTERGKHAQLLAVEGWYARVFAYQQIEQAVEEGR